MGRGYRYSLKVSVPVIRRNSHDLILCDVVVNCKLHAHESLGLTMFQASLTKYVRIFGKMNIAWSTFHQRKTLLIGDELLIGTIWY